MIVQIPNVVPSNNDGFESLSSVEQNRNRVIKEIINEFKSISCKNFYPIFGDAALYNVDCFLSELKNDNESKVEISALSGESIDNSDSIDRELTYSSSDFGSLKCKIHFANGCCTRYLETVVFEIKDTDSEKQKEILKEFKEFLKKAVKKWNALNDKKTGKKSDGNA